MKKINELRLLAGLPIKSEYEKTITEAQTVPRSRKELAAKSAKNMKARVENIRTALQHLESAYEALDNIPATDYLNDVPSLMSSLQDMIHGDGKQEVGGVQELVKVFEEEFRVWERHKNGLKTHRKNKKEQTANDDSDKSDEDQIPEKVEDDNNVVVEKETEIDDAEKEKDKKEEEEEEEEENVTKESMSVHTDGNFPISHENADDPVNVADNQKNLYYKNGEDFDESPNQLNNNKCNDSTKISVPAGIRKALQTEINQARSEAKSFERRRDFDSFNFYNDLANAFEELKTKLEIGTVHGMKEAQIFMTTLMGPMYHKIPNVVIKFVANGGVTRSLKNYMTDVSKEYPVTGKPFKNPGESK